MQHLSFSAAFLAYILPLFLWVSHGGWWRGIVIGERDVHISARGNKNKLDYFLTHPCVLLNLTLVFRGKPDRLQGCKSSLSGRDIFACTLIPVTLIPIVISTMTILVRDASSISCYSTSYFIHMLLQQPRYVDPLNLTSMACPAFPLCPLAITEAERGIPDILKRIRAVFEKVKFEALPNSPGISYMLWLNNYGSNYNFLFTFRLGSNIKNL